MTARPMRPKSPLGWERAVEPTLMPASRALKLASNLCQSSISLHPSKLEQESRLHSREVQARQNIAQLYKALWKGLTEESKGNTHVGPDILTSFFSKSRESGRFVQCFWGSCSFRILQGKRVCAKKSCVFQYELTLCKVDGFDGGAEESNPRRGSKPASSGHQKEQILTPPDTLRVVAFGHLGITTTAHIMMFVDNAFYHQATSHKI